MTHQEDLGAVARTIIDSNWYMALGTARGCSAARCLSPVSSDRVGTLGA
jgi:hypothetical protein